MKWIHWFKNPAFSLGFIILLHLTGWVGFWVLGKDFFLLTPLNMILSTVILFYHHQKWTRSLQVKLLLVAILGFAVEVAGINTGKIFGVYFYDQALGFKIWGTPPLIGINWVLLTYAATVLIKKWINNLYINAVLTAILLVALDLIIEPVAIENGFWHWQDPEIPLQNFIAWGLCAVLFSLLIQSQDEPLENPLAFGFIAVQFVFFGVLCWFT